VSLAHDADALLHDGSFGRVRASVGAARALSHAALARIWYPRRRLFNWDGVQEVRGFSRRHLRTGIDVYSFLLDFQINFIRVQLTLTEIELLIE
jgi:hypothetical protein